jgi:hypothetical protein
LPDYKEEGEGVVRSLHQELREIHSREDLISSSGRLKRHFDRLAEVMIAAEEYKKSNPACDSDDCTVPNRELSDLLRGELNRLYRLQGGRQIIERCQEQALHRLAAYHELSP